MIMSILQVLHFVQSSKAKSSKFVFFIKWKTFVRLRYCGVLKVDFFI